MAGNHFFTALTAHCFLVHVSFNFNIRLTSISYHYMVGYKLESYKKSTFVCRKNILFFSNWTNNIHSFMLIRMTMWTRSAIYFAQMSLNQAKVPIPLSAGDWNQLMFLILTLNCWSIHSTSVTWFHMQRSHRRWRWQAVRVDHIQEWMNGYYFLQVAMSEVHSYTLAREIQKLHLTNK